MADALTNALKRKEELERELAEIEQFLRLHDRFARTNREDAEPDLPNVQILGRPLRPYRSVLIKQRGRPADFAGIMERILNDVGRPLNRSELVDEIERRGVEIPSTDKQRYVGTILWRHDKTFRNIEGRGYWFVDRPPPLEDLLSSRD